MTSWLRVRVPSHPFVFFFNHGYFCDWPHSLMVKHYASNVGNSRSSRDGVVFCRSLIFDDRSRILMVKISPPKRRDPRSSRGETVQFCHSLNFLMNDLVAQLEEQCASNAKVIGSSPVGVCV